MSPEVQLKLQVHQKLQQVRGGERPFALRRHSIGQERIWWGDASLSGQRCSRMGCWKREPALLCRGIKGDAVFPFTCEIREMPFFNTCTRIHLSILYWDHAHDDLTWPDHDYHRNTNRYILNSMNMLRSLVNISFLFLPKLIYTYLLGCLLYLL